MKDRGGKEALSLEGDLLAGKGKMVLVWMSTVLVTKEKKIVTTGIVLLGEWSPLGHCVYLIDFHFSEREIWSSNLNIYAHMMQGLSDLIR